MEISSLFDALGGVAFDDMLVWAVALLAGVVAMIALVNAVDMFLEADAEAG
ncbi:MAG: hypothetical protein ABWZ88_12875 [Variovorax sp.]